MKPQINERLKRTINCYIFIGWRIDDYTSDTSNSFDYLLIAPKGRIYNSDNLFYNECSFCESNEDTCIHEQELLNEEKSAKNLLNLIKLLDRVTYQPQLP